METSLEETIKFAELYGSMLAYVEDKEIEYDLPTSMEITSFLAASAFLKDIEEENDDSDKAFLAIANEIARSIVKGEFYLDKENVIKKDDSTSFVDFVSYLLSTINSESFSTSIDPNIMEAVSIATKKGYEDRSEAHMDLCDSIFRRGDKDFDMTLLYDEASMILEGLKD